MWSMKIVKGADRADGADRTVQPRTEVQLPQPLARFSIGRDKAASWALDDRTLALSGRHCEIIDTPAGPALRDLSTNGTFVNGGTLRLAGEHLLRDGDRIAMGPFVFQVSGPPMPERPPSAPAVLSPHAAPARSPGVTDTAPQRGGDPAAMLAAGAAGAPVGLTEILRVAQPMADSGADQTKIRLAAPQPARSAPPAALPRSASSRPSEDGALREALARGLGLPPADLSGHDALQLAEGLARTAQAAIAALRQLLEHQAQARDSLDADPLRRASSAEAAALALALTPGGPQALLQRTVLALSAHEDRLRAALRSAAHPAAAGDSNEGTPP